MNPMSQPEDKRTSADKAAQEKAFNFSSYNKLHWMLGGEDYALKTARDLFVQDLKRAQKYEQDICRHSHRDVVMDNNMFNKVCDLVSKCSSFYEVEALARCIFDENIMPTMEEVKHRGVSLRKIMPVFDILKSTKNVRRSF
jgi:hypothetical protein